MYKEWGENKPQRSSYNWSSEQERGGGAVCFLNRGSNLAASKLKLLKGGGGKKSSRMISLIVAFLEQLLVFQLLHHKKLMCFCVASHNPMVKGGNSRWHHYTQSFAPCHILRNGLSSFANPFGNVTCHVSVIS